MRNLAVKKNFLASAQAQTVEYLTPDEVYAIADASMKTKNENHANNQTFPKFGW